MPTRSHCATAVAAAASALARPGRPVRGRPTSGAPASAGAGLVVAVLGLALGCRSLAVALCRRAFGLENRPARDPKFNLLPTFGLSAESKVLAGLSIKPSQL